jgi:AraC-like DNA-binding protein
MPTSSTPRRDWVRQGADAPGLERIEAFFAGEAYGLHRHDTYAIGLTMSGVQSFTYRGQLRHSLAGHAVVLHPDEAHDGHAGTADGFRYRMLYVQPAALQEALGGSALPFVAAGTSTDPRLGVAVRALLADLREAPEAFERQDALLDLALALRGAAGASPDAPRGDWRAARRARELLDDDPARAITLDELASACDRDRWSLSRDFRRFFGTSPHRYLTLRRLDQVRRGLRAGGTLADCALAAGFADQSHMTRQFTKAFGVTPAQWRRMCGAHAAHTNVLEGARRQA